MTRATKVRIGIVSKGVYRASSPQAGTQPDSTPLAGFDCSVAAANPACVSVTIEATDIALC